MNQLNYAKINELIKSEEVALFDVRTSEEFEFSNIPKSVNLPLATLENLADQFGKISAASSNELSFLDFAKQQYPNIFQNISSLGQPIFVYCLSGGRSQYSLEILKNLGFLNVENIGGIVDWPFELNGKEILF